MDELPEEQDAEEGHAAGVDAAGMGGPAYERGQCARNRPNRRRQRRPKLERGVHRVVEKSRHRRHERGQPAQPEPDVPHSGKQQGPSEGSGVRFRDSPGGDRTAAGPDHDGVRRALQVLVQGKRSGGAERGPQHEVEQIGVEDIGQRRHQVAGCGGQRDESRDSGLGQLQVGTRPPEPGRLNALLDAHCRAARGQNSPRSRCSGGFVDGLRRRSPTAPDPFVIAAPARARHRSAWCVR